METVLSSSRIMDIIHMHVTNNQYGPFRNFYMEDLAKISNKPIFSGFGSPQGPTQYPKSPTRSQWSNPRKSIKTEKIEVKCKHFLFVPPKPEFPKLFSQNYFHLILHTLKYPEPVKTKKNVPFPARNQFLKSKFHEKNDLREIKF